MQNEIHKGIYWVLINFSSYDRPLTAAEVCRRLKDSHAIDISETQLRGYFAEIIDQIATWKIPEKSKLVMSCSRGFCIAENEEQYKEGINWIKSRMEPIHHRIIKMESLSRVAFGQQLSLPL